MLRRAAPCLSSCLRSSLPGSPPADVEAVVIGAGVVGLATARALAQAGCSDVLIIESAASIGQGVSSRSSEVIHAGLYYPHGSLKASLCVKGKSMLYEYCRSRAVPFAQPGKLVVASRGSEPALDRIQASASAAGVHDLRRLSGAEARAMEPALECAAGLLSPSTGIVDSHSLMEALCLDAEDAGATLALNTSVEAGGTTLEGLLRLTVRDRDSGEASTLTARTVINAAGLAAQRVSSLFPGASPLPPLHLAKGNYFSLKGGVPCPFSRLVYPVPVDGGLGVHLTLSLSGAARFGPDVEWVEREDYDVHVHRAEAFYPAIRQYWPGLPDEALVPDYAGIRPKLSGPGEPVRDFVVGPASSPQGLVHLLGIESPGITAALAIGEMAAAICTGKLCMSAGCSELVHGGPAGHGVPHAVRRSAEQPVNRTGLP